MKVDNLNRLSSQEIWNKYLEGEEDLSTYPSVMDNIRTSLSKISLYITYSSSSNPDHLIPHLKDVVKNEEISRLFNQISLDPNISNFLAYEVLRKGVDPMWRGKDNQTSIHHLSSNCKYFPLYLTLKSQDHFSKSPIDNQGNTPLILACKNNPSSSQLKTISLLLDVDYSSIDFKDSLGKTALYFTWKNQNLKAFQLLLQRQASALVNLSLFALEIETLKDLDHALNLHPGNAHRETLKNLPSIQRFISPQITPKEMIDYKSQNFLIKIQYSKLQILNKMLLFRVREEIRHLQYQISIRGLPQQPIEDPQIIKEKRLSEELEYHDDLFKRESHRSKRKESRTQEIQIKKQMLEKEMEERDKEDISSRLEKEFIVKLSGLYSW